MFFSHQNFILHLVQNPISKDKDSHDVPLFGCPDYEKPWDSWDVVGHRYLHAVNTGVVAPHLWDSPGSMVMTIPAFKVPLLS